MSKNVKIVAEYHDTLNPDLWNGAKLKLPVSEKLVEISDAFVEFIDLAKLDIVDVFITGSNCNYNWTKQSDIDLHIVYDRKKAVKEYGSLVEDFLAAKKKIWNDIRNITVKGYDVEVYTHADDEEHTSTGVYSIDNNGWITKPEHNPPSVDSVQVQVKVKEITKMLEMISSGIVDSPEEIEKIRDKIWKMRQAGLANAGEFSVENVAFKSLRAAGLLDKMFKAETKAVDKKLSLEGVSPNIATMPV